MKAVEGYASATSVFPGETINLALRSELPHFFLRIRIYRVGREDRLVKTAHAMAAPYATPSNSYASGCGWRTAYPLTVPRDWSVGYTSPGLQVSSDRYPWVLRQTLCLL